MEHTPLPQPFAALQALREGLLLIGPSHSSAYVLTHPLQVRRASRACAGCTAARRAPMLAHVLSAVSGCGMLKR